MRFLSACLPVLLIALLGATNAHAYAFTMNPRGTVTGLDP